MSLSIETEAKIKKIVKVLNKSRSILFVTGAGISAESGLPTYRGIGGLYEDRLTENGIPVEMALSGQILTSRPEITWKCLSEIEKNCRGAKFNRAHQIIAEIESHFERVLTFTQNIDGFHRQAQAKHVIDIHGDMHDLYCLNCDWKETVEDYSQLQIPPKCPLCQGDVRPDVVFFGEMLPVKKILALDKELSLGFDICFSIGTTSVFPYIQQPVLKAKANNKFTVEINPGNSEISSIVDLKLSLGAVQALENIWQKYLKE